MEGSTRSAAGQFSFSLDAPADTDLRALPASTRDLISQAEEIRLLSDLSQETVWQLSVIRQNQEIPGGGLLMFEEASPRRLVAIYEHPVTSTLGVLGEQGPEDSLERVAEIAAGYGTDGARILPTFEIITTVASTEPGRDGDYSAATKRDLIRPWIQTLEELLRRRQPHRHTYPGPGTRPGSRIRLIPVIPGSLQNEDHPQSAGLPLRCRYRPLPSRRCKPNSPLPRRVPRTSRP